VPTSAPSQFSAQQSNSKRKQGAISEIDAERVNETVVQRRAAEITSHPSEMKTRALLPSALLWRLISAK